jgi:hypothetical protein
MSKSTNGGATWTDQVISASSFVPTSSVFFGDYTNVTAYNNVVRPIWIRLDGTALSCMTAIIGTPTGIEEPKPVIPSEYLLEQNVPNPFNPNTTIRYSIPKDGYVSLKVYNLIGQEVASLINEFKTAGSYSFEFYGTDLSSGIYFYRLISGNYAETKKMILNK